MFRTYKILPHEIGLHFSDDQFVGIRHPGRHYIFAPFRKERIDIVSTRDILLQHRLVADIVRADRKQGLLKGLATSMDLTDQQRALVWVDGRFFKVLGAGAHVLWTEARRVRVDVVEIDGPRFEHEDLEVITRHASAADFMEVCDVKRDHAGVYFRSGRYVETLEAGRYAFWKKTANTRVIEIDMREAMLDVAGQDVMTADHVTLRLNAVVAYKVVNARTRVGACEDVGATLYREAQLVLRDVIGGQTLDQMLGGKEQIAAESQSRLEHRASEFGLAIVAVGIRDVVLPGEMKDLLNQVTAAKKAAEANLISRREETAAIRSQANTAKLLDASPTLMRMRELEVLEKIAESTNLQVHLGDGSNLSDRVTKLI
jgi:regulator of protease activity HflC (stomatin/prohibitin superfamily)